MKKKALVSEVVPTVNDPLGSFLDPTLKELLTSFVKGDRMVRTSIVRKERMAMERIEAALSLSLAPAKPDLIQNALAALMLHYPVRTMDEKQRQSVLADWIMDLGEFPADVVHAVILSWRRGSNSYAPTPGHLLELGEPIIRVRKMLQGMVDKALAEERRHVAPDVENKRLNVG